MTSFINLRLVQTRHGPSKVKTVGSCSLFEYAEPHECITKYTECYSNQKKTFSCTSQMCCTSTRHANVLS